MGNDIRKEKLCTWNVLKHHNLKWQKLKQSKLIKCPIKKGKWLYIHSGSHLSLFQWSFLSRSRMTSSPHLTYSSALDMCDHSPSPERLCSLGLTHSPNPHQDLIEKQTQRLPPKALWAGDWRGAYTGPHPPTTFLASWKEETTCSCAHHRLHPQLSLIHKVRLIHNGR